MIGNSERRPVALSGPVSEDTAAIVTSSHGSSRPASDSDPMSTSDAAAMR